MLAYIHTADNTDLITEEFMDISSPEARQKFDNMFGFHEVSIEDLHYEGGVAQIEHHVGDVKFDVFIGENMMNVACVAEFHLKSEATNVH